MEEKQEAIQESLRALTQFFVNDGTLGDTLLRVSEMACEFTPAKYAGITMMVKGHPAPGSSRITMHRRSTRRNTGPDEGPCMYAFRDQRDVPHRFDPR